MLKINQLFTRSFNSRISTSRPLTSFSSCSTRPISSLLSEQGTSNSPLKFPLIVLRPTFEVPLIVHALATLIYHYNN